VSEQRSRPGYADRPLEPERIGVPIPLLELAPIAAPHLPAFGQVAFRE